MKRPAAHCQRCGAELVARRGQVAKCAHAVGLCCDCWLTVPAPSTLDAARPAGHLPGGDCCGED